MGIYHRVELNEGGVVKLSRQLAKAHQSKTGSRVSNIRIPVRGKLCPTLDQHTYKRQTVPPPRWAVNQGSVEVKVTDMHDTDRLVHIETPVRAFGLSWTFNIQCSLGISSA
jgi:hypothetical protein